MLIGELLVKDGVLTATQVEEGLAAQVLNGGRLGTNLVELGYLDEGTLARALGKQRGVHFTHGDIVPSPECLALIDLNYADEKDILPARLDGNRLLLLVIDPDDIETHDYVAARTGKRVVPVVVPEFRMAQLQRRWCKAFRPVREIDIEAVRRKVQKSQAAPVEKPAGEDLMSEDEFTMLYAAAMSGGGALGKAEGGLVESVVVEELPEIEVVPIEEEVAPVVPTIDLSVEEIAVAVPPPAPRATSEDLARRRRADRRAREERLDDAQPISFAEAQRALASISDRDDIARVVLRFAAGKFTRALLLHVQGDMALGWHGAGSGLAPGIARRIGVTLKKPSAFKLVRDSRSHFLGPLRRDFATVMFLKTLGAGEPRTAVLMPILAAGRVVNVLYGDNGPGQFASPDVGELLILAQSVGRSYEKMIAARKKAGRRP